MGQRFYTVDRRGQLTADLTIERIRYDDLEPAVMQSQLDALFPEGVTKHGETYLVSGEQSAMATNANIELLFEYVRRSEFHEAPSRFEAVFAFGSLDEAKAFRADDRFCTPDMTIWEIETQSPCFRADMSLLTLGGTPLVVSYFAHRYWSQQPNDAAAHWPDSAVESIWEVLLVPPVHVVSRADPAEAPA